MCEKDVNVNYIIGIIYQKLISTFISGLSLQTVSTNPNENIDLKIFFDKKSYVDVFS